MNRPVLTYTVTARVIGPGVSRAEAGDKTAAVEFDTSAAQSETHLGPAELLLTAFAACVLKNVERMSRLQPFAYSGASIEVVGEREDRPPRMIRIRYTLRVETDEPARRVELLHRNIAGFGTIYNTLAAACDVAGEIVAVTSPERLAETQRFDPDDVRPGEEVGHGSLPAL
jgi:uncharacterized OsmC-like protein